MASANCNENSPCHPVSLSMTDSGSVSPGSNRTPAALSRNSRLSRRVAAGRSSKAIPTLTLTKHALNGIMGSSGLACSLACSMHRNYKRYSKCFEPIKSYSTIPKVCILCGVFPETISYHRVVLSTLGCKALPQYVGCRWFPQMPSVHRLKQCGSPSSVSEVQDKHIEKMGT
jgi:hypothetical protein